MNTTRRLAGSRDAVIPVPDVTKAPVAIALDLPWTPLAHTFLGQVGAGIVDLFAALGVVLCVPAVILAIGIPFALCIRVLLWMTGAL